MAHVINNVLIGLNNLGRVFCDYAAGVFVQSALLVILLLVVDLLLRKRVRAVFRYCVWLLVLVKLILPPTLSLPTGIGYWVGDHLPAAFPTSNRAFDVAGLERASPSGEMLQVRPARVLPDNDSSIMLADSALTPLTWQAVLFVLWLVGVFAFLVVLVQRIRFVRGLIAVSNPAKKELLGLLEQCRRKIGVRWDIRLRISDTIPSPAVCGFFRPAVLIPAPLVEKLSPEGLRATLIHELAHIKRGDLWVNSVQTFLQVIYFYNPFVWFANAIIRRVCEEAVDETVLVTLGGEAKNYSNTLIDIGEMAFWRADLGLRLIGVAESKKALQWRIKHMLNRPIPKSSKLGALGIIVIFTIAAVLLPMARAQKPGEKSEPIASENQQKSTKSLHQAAHDGDIEQVRLLISKGADANSKDAMERTPLHYAAQAGEMEVAQLLIKAGADLNCKDKDGQTPARLAMANDHISVVELLVSKGADVSLHLAAYLGDLAKVKSFIESGIDINAKGQFGVTPLYLSLINRLHKDVAELLLDKGANPNTTAKNDATLLHQWAWGGDPAITKSLIEFLVSKGADVNALQGESRWTPLHSACHQGRGSVAKVLIDNGADINAKDKWGWTPLYEAIWEKDLDTVKLLIARGADIQAKDSKGWTPFRYAALVGSRDMVELFVAKGADVSSFHLAAFIGDLARVKRFIDQGTDVHTKDKFGWTPLYWAACTGQRDVAEFLVAKGADVNAKTDSDGTALHQAGRSGARELAELLIAKGADVNANIGKGFTPLHEAARTGHRNVAAILLTNGADIHAKNKYGITPLRLAAGIGHQKVAELLVTEGADVNLADNFGWTPLHWAAKEGYMAIAELLIGEGAGLNPKKYDGGTPLHSAASEGRKNTVELLIARGADVNAEDNQGRTPLWYAKDKGHTEIVELLRKHGAKE